MNEKAPANKWRRACGVRARRLWRRVASDRVSVFLLGFLIGVFLAVALHVAKNRAAAAKAAVELGRPLRDYDFAYEKWLDAGGLKRVGLDPDVGRYNTSSEEKERTLESEYLRRKVHVTCLVFPESDLGAKAVHDTWGSHCNELRIYSHKLENATFGLEKISSK